MRLVLAGNHEVDRSTVTYAVTGDKHDKIFNIMFALGEHFLLCRVHIAGHGTSCISMQLHPYQPASGQAV